MDVLSEAVAAVPTWLVLLMVIGITIFWYLKEQYSYWKRAGIPYFFVLPFSRASRKFSKMALFEIDLDNYKTYGRFFGSFEGKTPVLMVAEPDILRDIFVKDFQYFTGHRMLKTGDPLTDNMLSFLHGKDWKRVRSVISPTFSTGKIKKMTSIFTDCAKTLTNNFKTAAREDKPVDVERFLGAFTMDVIASSAFGTKIDSHNDPENPFVAAAKKLSNSKVTWRFILCFLLPPIARFFKMNLFDPDAMKFFERATLSIVQERKQSGQRRNDFLQLLIDAEEKGIEKEGEIQHENDEEMDTGHERDKEQTFKLHADSKSLSNTELVAQCVNFFLAGHNTTSGTLTFTAYELAVNPEVQDKLIAEIDRAIEEKGELSYEAITEMKYLDNVISETLRKYPPGFRTDRLAEEDYYIEKYNVTVPKGMVLSFPIYALHHDPEYYPDPEKYDPDRFSAEQKSARHPYAYLPFGAGPRNCVAMRFALMEMKVCLAYVLSQCRFSTCADTQIPLEFVKNILTMQPQKVELKIEIRSDAEKLSD